MVLVRISASYSAALARHSTTCSSRAAELLGQRGHLGPQRLHFRGPPGQFPAQCALRLRGVLDAVRHNDPVRSATRPVAGSLLPARPDAPSPSSALLTRFACRRRHPDVIGTLRTARGDRLWAGHPVRASGGSGSARRGPPAVRGPTDGRRLRHRAPRSNSGRCRRRGAQPRGVGGAGWDGVPWPCPLPGGAVGALPRGASRRSSRRPIRGWRPLSSPTSAAQYGAIASAPPAAVVSRSSTAAAGARPARSAACQDRQAPARPCASPAADPAARVAAAVTVRQYAAILSAPPAASDSRPNAVESSRLPFSAPEPDPYAWQSPATPGSVGWSLAPPAAPGVRAAVTAAGPVTGRVRVRDRGDDVVRLGLGRVRQGAGRSRGRGAHRRRSQHDGGDCLRAEQLAEHGAPPGGIDGSTRRPERRQRRRLHGGDRGGGGGGVASTRTTSRYPGGTSSSCTVPSSIRSAMAGSSGGTGFRGVGASHRRKRRRVASRYTPVRSARCWASRRRPRWASTRTVPARLPTISPTCAASRPAITRSATTSAWSGGSAAISASASRVACASTRGLGRVVGGRPVRQLVRRDRPYRSPGGLPGGVDRAHPRHGEHPGPEAGLVAAEPAQAPADLEPHVGRGVLGGRRRDHPQVAQHRRVEVPPEHRERVLVAVAGIGEVSPKPGPITTRLLSAGAGQGGRRPTAPDPRLARVPTVRAASART